jgi:hypothetical protein
MSAEHKLEAAYQEWRRLAEVEGEAIRTWNWPLLSDCQSALEKLQHLISRLIRDTRDEWRKLGVDSAQREQGLRAQVLKLIDIESRNKVAISEAKRKAETELSQLDLAGRTLRQVQRSYSSSQPAVWTSFS